MSVDPARKKSFWSDAVFVLLHHERVFGKWGGPLALLGFLLIEWLGHASGVIVEKFSGSLYEWLTEGQPLHLEGLPETFLPLLLAAAFLYAVKRKVHHSADSARAKVSPLQPHEGLIASLSRSNSVEADAKIAAAAIATPGSGPNPREHLLSLCYSTNLGPLAAAVDLHGRRLRHVWLLCTSEAEPRFELAKACITFLVGHEVVVEKIRIDDSNDVHHVLEVVHHIFDHHLANAGLADHQVIADITGGTAAMTSGMTLATLDESRRVQYLRQGVKLDIAADLSTLFRYVPTSPNDVARAFIGFLRRKTRTGSQD